MQVSGLILQALPNARKGVKAKETGQTYSRRFFYASSACIYPENRQLNTEIEGGGLKEEHAWPAQVGPTTLCQIANSVLDLVLQVLLSHKSFTLRMCEWLLQQYQDAAYLVQRGTANFFPFCCKRCKRSLFLR